LQSGSYVRAAQDPIRRAELDRYTAEIASVLESLESKSMLEAGVGEATTLCPMLERMKRKPEVVGGFDISWSRLAFAQRFARGFGFEHIHFFTGDLFRIPVVDNAFDLVYTSHAIEPNHGREREILRELYRVARRWLVLFEPSFELGSKATRERIEEHGYCRGLPDLIHEFGWEITRHCLLGHQLTEDNQTAVLVVRKNDETGETAPTSILGCPLCHTALQLVRGQYFCAECGRVFPVLDDIPCLLGPNGILASKYAEVSLE
jgi:SAM-dependent methyltransferase